MPKRKANDNGYNFNNILSALYTNFKIFPLPSRDRIKTKSFLHIRVHILTRSHNLSEKCTQKWKVFFIFIYYNVGSFQARTEKKSFRLHFTMLERRLKIAMLSELFFHFSLYVRMETICTGKKEEIRWDFIFLYSCFFQKRKQDSQPIEKVKGYLFWNFLRGLHCLNREVMEKIG